MIDLSILPSERRPGSGGWTPNVNVGVRGGIPTRTNIVAVQGLDPTGVADASAAITTAITNANAGDILLLPEGNFKLDSSIYRFGPSDIKNNFTLRGTLGENGELLTKLLPYGGVAAISIGANSDYTWTWPPTGNGIVSGATKGSTEVTVTDVSAFSTGKMAKVVCTVDNTTLPVVSVRGYSGNRGQMVYVTGVNNTAKTITFEPALLDDYSADSPKIFACQTDCRFVGFEDFEIDADNSSAGTAHIDMEQCYSCWVKNVVIRNSANRHIHVYDSLQCQIQDSDFYALKGGNTPNHAGILLDSAHALLCVNNVITQAFPGIEVNFSSAGCVFAYNFIDNCNKSILSNHGPHPQFNLYDGNILSNVQSDGYFGSAARDSLFRNWITGLCAGIETFTLCLNRFTRDYTLVGNLLGHTGKADSGLSFGNPNMGNSYSNGTASVIDGDPQVDFSLTGTLTTRTGNRTGTITFPGGTGQLTSGAQGPLIGGEGQTRTVILRWGTGSSLGTLVVSAIAGNTATFTDEGAAGGDDLPAEGTTIRCWPGQHGFQELDLDVETTTTLKDNYIFSAGAIDHVLVGETLPDCMVYETRPSWYPADTTAFPWPPFNPAAPGSASVVKLPAGDRYTNGRAAAPAQNPPTAPSALTATASSATTIDLTWTDNSNDESGFYILRGPSADALSVVDSIGAGASSYQATGLTASTVYIFAVRAFNGGGSSTNSNTASATTQPGPSPINAPTGATATAVSPTQVTVTWADNSTDETGFRVYEGETLVATKTAGVTTHTVSGLSPGTEYTFSVSAYNATGESAHSASATVITDDAPITPPTSLPASISTAPSSMTLAAQQLWRRLRGLARNAAFAATVTPVPNQADIFNIGTLTGAITIANPRGVFTDGQLMTLRIAQDVTGSRAITWGNGYAFSGDVTAAGLPTTASASYEVTFRYHGTTDKWRAISQARGF